MKFSEIENTVFFRAKKLVERWYLLNSEKSCFEVFRDEIYGLFLSQKLMERWYLLITGKFFYWTFRRWEIRSFFEPKSWWKHDINWSLKSSCLELFGDGKYGIFFSEKVDGEMIFTWSFLAFHDIPGLGKYGFLCSVKLCSYWMCFCFCFFSQDSYRNFEFCSVCKSIIKKKKKKHNKIVLLAKT